MSDQNVRVKKEEEKEEDAETHCRRNNRSGLAMSSHFARRIRESVRESQVEETKTEEEAKAPGGPPPRKGLKTRALKGADTKKGHNPN